MTDEIKKVVAESVEDESVTEEEISEVADEVVEEEVEVTEAKVKEEEDEDEGIITTAEGDRIPGKQEDEILCEGCFLLVKESQYDMRDNVAICPHCGSVLDV